jgi:hypothetical protein
MGYVPHPIGMTMQFPVAVQTKVNDPLFSSRAEWISPGYDDEMFAQGGHPMAPGSPASHWLDNPPPNDGRKVVISDTDHYSSSADALWAWKSFLRGHHPILMDYGIIGGMNPPDPAAGGQGVPPYAAFEAARYAMGDTLRYAQKINLIEMEPRTDASSTEYALANPGQEYLILQPADTAEPFSVKLEPGTYAVEWFSVNQRQRKAGGQVDVRSAGDLKFNAPFDAGGPVVLYLKQVNDR